MKRLNSILAALLLAVTVAVPISMVNLSCTTSQHRQAVNTLYSVGKGVDAAYRGYLDAVISGQVPTNGVPGVARQYTEFQNSFNAVLLFVSLNTNAVATPGIISQAAALTLQIESSKKGVAP